MGANPEASVGLVQLYTGDGKGKTTAALGLALRAAGWGYRTFIGQFLKRQDYGELHSLARLADWITIEQFGRLSFVRAGQIRPQDRADARRGLARIQEVLLAGQYRIVVMDEICVALHFQVVTLAEVLELIERRPTQVELVLTGRRAPLELIERADLVTEMREVKHPYQRGISARQGIEH